MSRGVLEKRKRKTEEDKMWSLKNIR